MAFHLFTIFRHKDCVLYKDTERDMVCAVDENDIKLAKKTLARILISNPDETTHTKATKLLRALKKSNYYTLLGK